ncbi:MAG: LPS-assembly protein LptD [Candidatus Acidiferrales bacterium]
MAWIKKHAGLFLARAFCLLLPAAAAAQAGWAQRLPPASSPTTVRLEAEQQRKEGDSFFADGKVVIRYRNLELRADHVQYNSKTYEATARGNVTLDVDTQHLAADRADFNVSTGVGRFEHVRGAVNAAHPPNSAVLVSPNPLIFEAAEVRRLDARTYTVDHAWLTVCLPEKPSWKFYASHATLHVEKSVALVDANFRLFRVPLLYLPYATFPAGRNLRQSGLLMPEFSDTSLKGIVVGDGYYWAPKSWMDLSLGGAYLSRRGGQQNEEFRAKPWENVTLSAKYFGVIDRGLPTAVTDASGNVVNELVKQGGHSAQFELDAHLPHGWRAVTDYNQLSSLTFQLAFAPTFGDAVNSEVRSSEFLTNNFHGFSVDLAANSYKDFLNAQPEIAVNLRSAPEVRLSSVDQAPWRHVPVYFGLDTFAGAVHRSDETLTNGAVVPGIDTGALVERSEFAPRVVIPLRVGPWFGVTTSYTVRTTSYGAQVVGSTVVNSPVNRTTGELHIDLRPPTLERVWKSGSGKWKHTIEPDIEYNYVRGVNQFDRFILFDDDETLTDTNEFMYSITQRLFHRSGDGQADELASWTVAQKYYFDPTFNGALVPGTRNVFQALDDITPFAFADEPRRFSPIDSLLQITPGGDYDAEVRLDYDTVRHRFSTAGTLLKIRPTQNFNFTVAHFSIDNNAILQPLANQIRAEVGYGDATRHGWNASFGFSYDVKQNLLQNQLVQVGYNGSCCGIAFEYRRLALGPIRTENQFRVALIIANIGAFGNLQRQDKLF